jgi:hypothetical protein
MVKGARISRVLGRSALVASLLLGFGALSCRTTVDDVNRWANTSQGPRRLVAVLTHDKYPMELRVEAALALVKMKPRSGRRIGIQGSDDQPGLMEVLAQLPPGERAEIVRRMAPSLIEEMKKAPPTDGTPDPSFPYKDTSFILLTHDGGSLIPDEETKKSLRDALMEWCLVNFAERMDDSSQLYGTEQVLRELKADGVRGLPKLILPDAKKIDRVAALLAELGDAKTKLEASKQLTVVAQEVGSENWMKKKAPSVEAANKASKLNPKPDQFRAQLEQYQEEELLRIFSSMKLVGQAPVVDYLLGFAAETGQAEKRRAAALAALEGNLDRTSAKHAQAVLAIAAGKDTPDAVRDIALRRVGEMPRQLVASQLLGLFKNDNWKVRWLAAEVLLQLSSTAELDEFMRRLSAANNMAITEPLRYGALIGAMKGTPKAADLVPKYLSKDNSVQARLAAFGYYYDRGTSAELAKVSPYSSDGTKVPECGESAKDCEWKCAVGQDLKEISTVGDFVQYCVTPAMEKRAAK